MYNTIIDRRLVSWCGVVVRIFFRVNCIQPNEIAHGLNLDVFKIMTFWNFQTCPFPSFLYQKDHFLYKGILYLQQIIILQDEKISDLMWANTCTISAKFEIFTKITVSSVVYPLICCSINKKMAWFQWGIWDKYHLVIHFCDITCCIYLKYP